jgi:hypothetical protein
MGGEVGTAEVILLRLAARAQAEGLGQMRLDLRGIVDKGGDQPGIGGKEGCLVARPAWHTVDQAILDQPGDQPVAGAIAGLRQLNQGGHIHRQALQMAVHQFQHDVPIGVWFCTWDACVKRRTDLAQKVDHP